MMASISVVQYSTSSHTKMNVLQQSNSDNNNAATAERKGIIILSKNGVEKQDILITNPARKKMRAAGRETTRVSNPPPIAVARRNARERNRVKQVNNGFATLRQHIPNSIAAAYESSSGRGGNKKLSKVETLRMAVDYIRTLEDMLAGSDDSENSNVSSSSISISSYPSPTPSSPAVSTSQPNMTYNFTATSSLDDDDDLSSTNPTPPPQQHHHHYVRINNANYEILPLYETNENLEPLDENLLNDTHLIEFGADQDLFTTMDSNGSLSPDIYSDHSLSPPMIERSDKFMIGFNERIVNEQPLIDEIKFRIVPPEQDLHMTQQEPGGVLSFEQQETNIVQKTMGAINSWWNGQQQQQQIQLPVSTAGS